MTLLDCSTAGRLTAWPCASVVDSNGQAATMLTPPVSFWGGAIVPVFVLDRDPYYEITDDCGILHHLYVSGFRIADDGRKQTGLRRAVQRHGVELSDQLHLYCKKSEVERGLRKYLAAMFEVKHWECEAAGKGGDPASLISEAELYLTAINPAGKVKHDIPALSITGKPQVFPLQIDETLYDTTRPSGSAHLVKKLVDVRSVPSNQDLDITVVLDDRDDQERAREDFQVFTQLAHVMKFTDLRARGIAAMA